MFSTRGALPGAGLSSVGWNRYYDASVLWLSHQRCSMLLAINRSFTHLAAGVHVWPACDGRGGSRQPQGRGHRDSMDTSVRIRKGGWTLLCQRHRWQRQPLSWGRASRVRAGVWVPCGGCKRYLKWFHWGLGTVTCRFTKRTNESEAHACSSDRSHGCEMGVLNKASL